MSVLTAAVAGDTFKYTNPSHFSSYIGGYSVETNLYQRADWDVTIKLVRKPREIRVGDEVTVRSGYTPLIVDNTSIAAGKKELWVRDSDGFHTTYYASDVVLVHKDAGRQDTFVNPTDVYKAPTDRRWVITTGIVNNHIFSMDEWDAEFNFTKRVKPIKLGDRVSSYGTLGTVKGQCGEHSWVLFDKKPSDYGQAAPLTVRTKALKHA